MFTGRRPALALIVIGVFSIVNGLVAALKNAERNYFIPYYVNTHWITTIIFCTGLVHRTTIDGDYFGEVFSFSTNILCLCICLTSVVTDYRNLKYLTGLTEITTIKSQDKLNDHLILYNVLDILVCLVAIPCCLYILRYLLQSNYHLPKTRKNVQVLGLGTGLICLAVIRAVVFLWEFSINISERVRSVYYNNYTIDEPSWIIIAICCGIITVLSASGSDLLRGVSIALCCTLIWPAIFYIWVDYRQFLGNEVTIDRGYSTLVYLGSAAIAIGIMQAFVLIAVALCQISQFPGVCKIRLEPNVRNLFIGLCCIFTTLFIIIVVVDIYAGVNNLFHTLFHSNEQKTPFYLIILIISTTVSIVPGFASLTLPLAFTVCLLTANSTLFQIGSYFFLTHHAYFVKKMCESMMYEESCAHRASASQELNIHLTETLAHFFVLLSCCLYAVVLIRIFRLNCDSRELSETDRKKTRKLENFVRFLAVLMCIGALLIMAALTVRDTTFDEIHPLVVIYGYVYHFSLAVSLVVYPLYQIVSSEEMHKYPMTVDSLICISAVRFVDCLSHLDYRGTGDDLNLEWRVHNTVDAMSLFCTLISLICLLHIRSIGKPKLETFDNMDMDFDNPLNLSADIGSSYHILQNQNENQLMDVTAEETA